MPRGRSRKNQNGAPASAAIEDYRHDATRPNIPPAKIAAEGKVPPAPRVTYSYNPRLDPVLRFDPTGKSDQLPELLETARNRVLTDEEARILADALRRHEPWLEWAGKRETKGFAVDPVALHLHERVAAQAILKVAARQDVTRDLFADPQQDYRQAVQFYQHDIDWTNRLILGDSLQVMVSLATREDLAGKVQMIYIDPPYGIKFSSNFQPTTQREDVKDQPSHLTREVELVRAYRDTWHLGVHSYLTYLRDRLAAAHMLLATTGAIFIQIGEENLHRVRAIVDDVFGSQNVIATILVKKKGGQKGGLLESVNDYIIFCAKCKERFKDKYNVLTKPLEIDDDLVDTFRFVEMPNGEALSISQLATQVPEDDPTRDNPVALLARFPGARLFKSENSTSGGVRTNQSVVFEFEGRTFDPGLAKGNCWKHTARKPEKGFSGMDRMAEAGRLYVGREQIGFRRYHDDFGRSELSAWWDGLGGAPDPIYVVQTNTKVIERCMQMATAPGDLVLDPTCGSGTTAYVAEQWGRRWITIDTSRVAVSLARQRLLTAQFEFYDLRNPNKGVDGGLRYKTAPHITSSVVANCTEVDPLVKKHNRVLDEQLKQCSEALAVVSDELRTRLSRKLVEKQKMKGKRAITVADQRRWRLPKGHGFDHWTVPFDTDPDYPKPLADAVTAYRAAWRAKMDDVNACVAKDAVAKELVNEPIPVRGVVRVSGPFTVEAVQPPEQSLDAGPESPIGGDPATLEETFAASGSDGEIAVRNVEAYLDQMMRLLKLDGVRFPDNKEMKFSHLEPLTGRSDVIHAEGRWMPKGQADPEPDGEPTVCVAFGPQYGPVTARQVEQLMRTASRRGYDDLVIAGFTFDGAAQAVIEEADHPSLRVHMAHIRPDVNPGMQGLLKDTPNSQLFTVFGQPRTRLEGPDKEGQCRVIMEGVDIYDPLTSIVTPTRADKVAAWFIDGDYDGRTFCITQAFFPDKGAWEKLAKALKDVVDEEAFAALSGTESLPFPLGENRCVAIKVIDPRGNEVMRLHRAEG